jgi:membrane-bound serine protease (ClpP class)
MDIWIWPILLLSLGLSLAILEVFFPTGGILAFFSGAAMLGAILLGFRSDPYVGVTMTGAAVVGVPILVTLGFRLCRQIKSLVGRMGRAKCRMLPSGVVSIDGQTLDATSEGMVIEAGQTVRVIKIEAKRLVVRVVEGEIPSPAAENPLERPIDSIADDPFGEPLI